MPTMPYGYHDRFDPARSYVKHLFLSGFALQGAELNEIQDYAANAIKMLGDALFNDGDVIQNARVLVTKATGATKAEVGLLYVAGAIRKVPVRNFTIPISGEVSIGVFLVQSVVTSLEDPALRDPAQGTRNYGEPGAARLKEELRWGWDGEGISASFFPVYEVVDGVLKAKDRPPEMASVAQALARYDRDSAGGNYVVSGLRVTQLNDTAGGLQVYSVAAGRARVTGFPMEFIAATRLEINPSPDLNFIDSEPEVSTTESSQRVSLDYYPVANVTQVRITKRKTVTMTHGSYSGAMDQIDDEAVLLIESITQGGVTFAQGTDYRLTAGKVDWSLAGAEPVPGSTYTLVYQAITSVAPDSVDATSCHVTGAVVGTLILVSYNQRLPRIDRICVTSDGELEYVKGVSAPYNPTAPVLSNGRLSLATVVQTWDNKRKVINDGVRVVAMDDIAAISDRVDLAMSLIAQQRLESNIHVREAGAKKGLFVDPFTNDDQRDQGISQTAAIFDGELSLGIIGGVVYSPLFNLAVLNSAGSSVVLAQTMRTTDMQVNPNLAFDPLGPVVDLSPKVDRWADVRTNWTSAVSRWFVNGFFSSSLLQRVKGSTDLSALPQDRGWGLATEMRQIDVQFEITGFKPNEVLSGVTFDGVAVTPSAI